MTQDSDHYDARQVCDQCYGTGWADGSCGDEGDPCADCNAWDLMMQRHRNESAAIQTRRAA